LEFNVPFQHKHGYIRDEKDREKTQILRRVVKTGREDAEVTWIDWVKKVLRSTRHTIGHFGDDPQANLLAWHGKTKPDTTKARIHQSKEM